MFYTGWRRTNDWTSVKEAVSKVKVNRHVADESGLNQAVNCWMKWNVSHTVDTDVTLEIQNLYSRWQRPAEKPHHRSSLAGSPRPLSPWQSIPSVSWHLLFKVHALLPVDGNRFGWKQSEICCTRLGHSRQGAWNQIPQHRRAGRTLGSLGEIYLPHSYG